MTLSEFRAILASDKVIDIILDTDTYNEIDDQFALAYAMLSNKKVNLLSVNAAPFFNSRSSSAAEGMEKSYNEIFNIMKLTDAEQAKSIPVYRGSTRFMSSKTDIVESEACDNIINTVMPPRSQRNLRLQRRVRSSGSADTLLSVPILRNSTFVRISRARRCSSIRRSPSFRSLATAFAPPL